MEGYTTTKENLHIFRGELALALAVIINSFGVVLMLYSGAGISAISSVPYAFSEVIPKVSLGTWTYIFQGLLVLSLMILRKKFVPQYLFSFVVGFIFSELLDVHKMWIDILPTDLGWCVLYFVVSYFLLCIGIALSNRCKLPIIPTDLFPRELSEIINVSYATVYKGNIIKNLIMDCQSYTKYRPNETTGGIFVSWRRKEELPTGA